MNRPAVQGVYEAVLYADDLLKAARFYTALLDRQPVSIDHDRGIAFRLAPSSMLLIFNPARTLEPSDLVPSHGARGQGHLAFAIDQGDADTWRNRLSELGIRVEREVEWPSGASSIYFRDPAGNSLELAQGQIWPH